ncbi:unnamed protein product [Penicillium nalgiovense]|nr:unnamed protein product [Penicillium nalgiovense]
MDTRPQYATPCHFIIPCLDHQNIKPLRAHQSGPGGGRRACPIASSALVPTAFALLWSPEPHPRWKCNVIASAFVTRVYCLNKLPCAPQRSFFEASADRDELERDVAWLVAALQRVVSDLVVKPI